MNAPRQYTIRNVPDDVDAVLRQRVRDTRKSFNQVALEALVAGTGKSLRPKRDFRDIAGGLGADERVELEREIELQRQIDPDLWQ